MFERGRVLFIGFAVAFALGCGGLLGTPLKQEERSYRVTTRYYDDLITQLPPARQAAVKLEVAEYATQYAALPVDSPAREAALEPLNDKMSASYDALEVEIAGARDALAKAAAGEGAALQKALVGHWAGGGQTLDITSGGNVSWKSEQGGVSKEVNAPIANVTGQSFDAGLFGVYSTFKVDVAPHEVDGAWRMTLDGAELTRSP